MLASVASAAYIKDVETKPKDIDPNGDFTVKVDLGGTTCGTQLKIYIDGKKFCSKNIGCETEEVESDKWELDDDPLECGVHKLQVDLIDGGSIIQSKTMDLRIGNVPEITLSPSEPSPNSEMKIIFRNNETGKLITDLDVQIYKTKLGTSSTKDYSVNNQGEVKFSSDSVGQFKLIIEDPDYCGTFNFWVKKPLPFAGPFPEDPVIGERMSVSVPGGVGVKYIDSEGKVYPLRNYGGGANFTINTQGEYNLVAAELSTIYWSITKNFSVSDKSRMSAKIEPENAVTNKVVMLTVSSRGASIENIPVKIIKPIGGSETFETNVKGEIRFTPETVGTYHYKIEKARYDTLEGDFEVFDAFDMRITPGDPVVEEDILLAVRDQLGAKVDNALVYIEDASGIQVTESTGWNGSFRFRLPDPGEYTIKVQKEGFWNFEDTMRVYGIISMELYPEEIETGDDVNISIKNKDGEETSAEVTVTKPDGRTQGIDGVVYTPIEVGVHKIKATKSGYREVSGELVVNPHPLDVVVRIEENSAIITAISHGEPVPGLVLFVTTPSEKKQAVTDGDGRVSALVEEEGYIIIDANNIERDERYHNNTIRREIVKRYDYSLLVLPLLLVGVFSFLGVFAVDYYHKQKDEPKRGSGLFNADKKGAASRDRKPKSSLSKP